MVFSVKFKVQMDDMYSTKINMHTIYCRQHTNRCELTNWILGVPKMWQTRKQMQDMFIQKDHLTPPLALTQTHIQT